MAAIAAGPVAAEDQFLGYTDIRLTGSTMPLDGWSSGGQEANFESGYRVSLMAIGPICVILPINCYTPPRLGGHGGSTEVVDTYGTYDDLVVERDFSFTDTRSYSYDWLLGFELSMNTFESGRQNQPSVDMSAVALSVHFGWGFEIATRTPGRWHWELTPFVGAGLADADVTPAGGGGGQSDEGVYYEVGGRLGSYYTFTNGIQIGAEVRYVYSDTDVEPFQNDDLSTSGITFGANVGYRF